MDELGQVVGASAAREALLARFFKNWTVTEQPEMFELHGWLRSGVQVRISGLKSEVTPVLRAFFEGLERLEQK